MELLAPLFVIIAIGYAMRKGGFVEAAFARQLNRIVFHLALPALLFRRVSELELTVGVFSTAAIAYVSAALVVALAAAVWARDFGPAVRGIVVQSAFRANLAYLGLPIVLTLLGERAAPAAVAVVSVGTIVNAILAVLVLQLFYPAAPSVGGSGRLTAILKNPLVLAIVLGVLVSATGVALPGPVEQMVVLLGQMSLPAVLLVIGLSLSFTNMASGFGLIARAVTLKLVVMPAVAWALLTYLLHVERTSVIGITLMCAMPVATAAHAYVGALGGDESLQAGALSVSTVAAIVTIPAWSAFLGV